MLKASLLKGGVTHVFMGRHGMKQYLVEKTLADLGDVPHPITQLDLGLMFRDPHNFWLFGIKPGPSGTWKDTQNGVTWKVYPMCPLSQLSKPDFKEGWIFGSLECKVDGQIVWGTDQGKVATLYSLLHHTKLALTRLQPEFPIHMHSLYNREAALQNFTHALLADLGKAGGGRIEVRCKSHSGAATTAAQVAPQARLFTAYMRDLCAAGHLKIMKLNLPEFQAGLQASWEWCRQANCFSGSHGSSPVPEEKLLPYLFLLSHLGFLSGRWSRPVQHSMVGQRGGNVMWVAGPAPPVAAPAMAMPGPPAQVVAGPSLLEQCSKPPC